jgi:thioredoxin reductase (NADPH)
MESIGADLREMQRRPLQADHVEAIRAIAREEHYDAGTFVAELGKPMDRFVYVLDGELELVSPLTGERYVPSTLGPTQFTGDIAFLNGGVWPLPIRACRPTRALVVDRPAMLELMSRIPEMSDHIITVYAARRRRTLEEGTTGLTLIGAERDRQVRRIAAFASASPSASSSPSSSMRRCSAAATPLPPNAPPAASSPAARTLGTGANSARTSGQRT